ncbi:hypothetical protein JAAARDRAFT_144077, partial [Jaapia argillacea MUCL 33604]
VYRVHWLCAWAMRTRWAEEVTILLHEMGWVVAFFRKRTQDWESLASAVDISARPGHRAYAKRQAQMWSMFADRAESQFKDAKVSHSPPLNLSFD